MADKEKLYDSFLFHLAHLDTLLTRPSACFCKKRKNINNKQHHATCGIYNNNNKKLECTSDGFECVRSNR